MHHLAENSLAYHAVALLKRLIATPSFSREEEETADLLLRFLQQRGIEAQVECNNVWARNRHFDPKKPTILLNSHHDTVKPNAGYTRDPFAPTIEGGKLYGLGSNDAGGCLVSLVAAFLHFFERADLPFNLLLACTAEEEVSGSKGIASLLPHLGPIECGLVGEPTQLRLATAEKGLLVLDCTALGQSGHAARNEGLNAIYEAMDDMAWFRSYRFERESERLGPVHMNVTMIEAGSQHNVVPDRCRFVVDVRTTDAYSNEETLEIIRREVRSQVVPRSTRLQPSGISHAHPLVQAGLALGLRTFGSPTLSDQALMPFPTLKMGPGDSARSHSADEYILVEEIELGIATYIALLEQVQF
jgi:acetylornithine deacetylase